MSRETTMQAVRVHAYGGVEQLTLERVACPAPGPQTVLVRVHAAGVNPVDTMIRQGWMQEYVPLQLPYIPGIDLAGVVEEAGPGVTEFSAGQAVYGAAMGGSYAEYALAAPATLAPKPESLSFEGAAAVPLGAATAWQAIFDQGGLMAGQRVLIHAAAGGVGSLAVQFACLKGAEVFATCSAANVDFVRTLGAHTVVDYQSTRFEDVVHDVDVVLDAVGGDVQERSFQTLRRGGILVSVVAPPSPEKAAQYGVRATMMGAQQSSALLREVGQLIDTGRVKPVVGHTFRLPEARQAHELSQTRHGRGRIVLQVAGE